jgi:chromosome segregation ATPase
MDDQTTKELLGIQRQLTSIVTRKRQRGDEEDLERKVKELERRLKDSFKRSQRMSAVYKQLKSENEQLQKRLEEQEEAASTTIEGCQEEVNELEKKNAKLMFKLRKVEERELASKKVLPVLKTKLDEALKAITELEK